MKIPSTYFFAQAYGTGNYGQGRYSCTTQQQQAGTCSSSSNSGGTLTNTGIEVVAIVTLACLIIFVSLVVRIWRRKPAGTKPKDSNQKRVQDDDQLQK
jgi:hypothetical protein